MSSSCFAALASSALSFVTTQALAALNGATITYVFANGTTVVISISTVAAGGAGGGMAAVAGAGGAAVAGGGAGAGQAAAMAAPELVRGVALGPAAMEALLAGEAGAGAGAAGAGGAAIAAGAAAGAAIAVIITTPIVLATCELPASKPTVTLGMATNSIDPGEKKNMTKYIIMSEEGCRNVKYYCFDDKATMDASMSNDFSWTTARMALDVTQNPVKELYSKGMAHPAKTIRCGFVMLAESALLQAKADTEAASCN